MLKNITAFLFSSLMLTAVTAQAQPASPHPTFAPTAQTGTVTKSAPAASSPADDAAALQTLLSNPSPQSADASALPSLPPMPNMPAMPSLPSAEELTALPPIPNSQGAMPAIPSSMPAQPTTANTMPPLPRGSRNRPEEVFVPSEIITAGGVAATGKKNEVRAVLRTSMGDITVRLSTLGAPKTAAHFVGLAKGEKEFIDVKTSKRVKRPFYNGLIFHRAVKGFLIQTGCPFGTGRGGPGDIAMIRDESNPRLKFDRPGILAMAPMRDGKGTSFVKDTNGSQFFITLKPMPEWDGKFTVFGEVEEGLDVVQKISEVKVGPTERPIKRVYLLSIDVFEGSANSSVKQTSDPSAVPSADPGTRASAPPEAGEVESAPQ